MTVGTITIDTASRSPARQTYGAVIYDGLDPTTLPACITEAASTLGVGVIARAPLPAECGGGVCATYPDGSVVILLDPAGVDDRTLYFTLAHELGHAADSRAGTRQGRDRDSAGVFADDYAAVLLGLDAGALAAARQAVRERVDEEVAADR